jgi:hypothetical protein
VAGILFPMALTYIAWDSGGGRATRPATALLCLTMTTILLGEALLFVPSHPPRERTDQVRKKALRSLK